MARDRHTVFRASDYLALLVVVLISALPTEIKLRKPGYVSGRLFSSPDARNYVVLASNLRGGKGFSPFGRDDIQDPWWLDINAQLEGLLPVHLYASKPLTQLTFDDHLPRETYHTPGYPVFLAGLMFSPHLLQNVHLILRAQLLLMVSASVALYYFLRRQHLGVTWSLVLTSLFCLNSTLILSTSQVLTDGVYTSLYVFFLVAFMNFGLHLDRRSLVLSSLTLCAISAIRPELVVLSLAYGVLILFRQGGIPFRKRLVFGAQFLGVSCAFVLFWALQNLQDYGIFKIATSSDVHVTWSVAPQVMANAQDIDFNTASRMLSEEAQLEMLRLQHEYGRPLNAFERAGILGHVGTRNIFLHWRTASNMFLRAAFMKVLVTDVFSFREIIGQNLKGADLGMISALLKFDIGGLLKAAYTVLRSNPAWILALYAVVVVANLTKVALFGLSVIALLIHRKYFPSIVVVISVFFFAFVSLTNYEHRNFLPALPVICVTIGIGLPYLVSILCKVRAMVGLRAQQIHA